MQSNALDVTAAKSFAMTFYLTVFQAVRILIRTQHFSGVIVEFEPNVRVVVRPLELERERPRVEDVLVRLDVIEQELVLLELLIRRGSRPHSQNVLVRVHAAFVVGRFYRRMNLSGVISPI